jgi:hypothetical protein
MEKLENMSTIERVIAGLTILMKYDRNIAVEHDVIYAGGDPNEVSSEDAAVLEALKWHIDRSCDSYAKFV